MLVAFCCVPVVFQRFYVLSRSGGSIVRLAKIKCSLVLYVLCNKYVNEINGVLCYLQVHVIGAKEAIPLLSLRLSKWAMRFGTPFILNKEVTIALYVMSVILVLVSSLVLYLYGYGRSAQSKFC